MSTSRMRVVVAPLGAAFLLLLASSTDAVGQTCRDSDRLSKLVDASVQDVVADNDASLLESQWPVIVANAVALSVLDAELKETEAAVNRFQTAQAETARSDKQVGAGSGSTGTTTLVEKVGVPRLLALAIEHNAIQQESNGTSLTLRSTPYALWIFLAGRLDTPDEYQSAGPLPRLGLSANFALDEGENEAPGNLDFERFTSFESKYQLFGDRSPRSVAFQERWELEVQPAIKKELAQLGGLLADVFNKPSDGGPTGLPSAINAASDKALAELTKQFEKQLGNAPQAGTMTIAVLGRLEADICQPLRTGAIAMSDGERERIRTRARALYAAEYARSEARANFVDLVKQWNKQASGSLAYSLSRVDGGTDYSEGKFILEGNTDELFPHTTAGLELAANAQISFNHHTDDANDVDHVRDYGASFSVGRTIENVLTGRFDPQGMGRIGVSLNGDVKRLQTADDVLGSVQLKFTLPIYAGFELPLSFSWSSRTEEDSDDVFRVSVGSGLDTDKLEAFGTLAKGLFGAQL